MSKQQRILIAPLDWGLGHATRCIPIIRLLIKKGFYVIIAADNRALALLRDEFPTLHFIMLKGKTINYPAKGSMIRKMFFSIPKILSGIYAEHKTLKSIIITHNIDIVISDNRYGMWNKDIKSIFITHQLMIKTPFAEKLLHRINLYFFNKYDECWIPDVEDESNLSGDLSHKYPLPSNSFFIGILSRFASPLIPSITKRGDEEMKYDVMAIISGPEPQRTLLEKIITEQLIQSGLKALVVCGKTNEEENRELKQNVETVNYLETNEMQKAILQSSIIIARSGYSSIMDMATLGKKAIFIPTPGQTEQEYLADLLMKKKIASYQKQSEFNLQQALTESKNYNGFETFINSDELERRIDLL